MTSTPHRFPPHPIRGVEVLHVKQNCAPHFALVEVDFEPASEGFAFEVDTEPTVDDEPAAPLSCLLAAAAQGIEDELRMPEHGLEIAARVVLRRVRANYASHETAFRIAGHLAARKALAGARLPSRDGSRPPVAGEATASATAGSHGRRHPGARADTAPDCPSCGQVMTSDGMLLAFREDDGKRVCRVLWRCGDGHQWRGWSDRPDEALEPSPPRPRHGA
ncbi:hypothetical protein [Streptomyces sp. NPDC047130]|uniref:hypothetical protein n=1 Tax=Streptomyces sp. NPDC047130 TaxID=3155261 RepID=UPI0033D77487